MIAGHLVGVGRHRRYIGLCRRQRDSRRNGDQSHHHGEDAKGNPELGAPNLIDKFWIYGGDLETIDTTIWDGRQGLMPTWEGRLSELDRKILTLYLLDKRTPTP